MSGRRRLSCSLFSGSYSGSDVSAWRSRDGLDRHPRQIFEPVGVPGQQGAVAADRSSGDQEVVRTSLSSAESGVSEQLRVGTSGVEIEPLMRIAARNASTCSRRVNGNAHKGSATQYASMLVDSRLGCVATSGARPPLDRAVR